MWRCVVVILCPWLVWASPVVQEPIGDQGTLGLRIDNQSVTAIDVRIGVKDELAFDTQVNRFETWDAWAQCIPDRDGQTIQLFAEVGGRRTVLNSHPLVFDDAPPALWISNRRKGRAHLNSLLQDAQPGVSLRHLRLGDVPKSFGALRFARLIIINGEDFASLDTRQQSAIQNAEAAGVMVVLTAPFGNVVETDFWVDGMALSPGLPPEEFPAQEASLAAPWRVIEKTGGGEVLVDTLRGAVAVEKRSGLGRRRIVGVDLLNLPAENVSRRVLSAPMDSVAPILRWLAGNQPLGPADPPGVEAHLIVLLVGLCIGIYLCRRSLAKTLLFVLCWSVACAFIPPSLSPVSLESSRTVLIPFQGGSLAVTSFDLSVAQGGEYILDGSSAESSIEDARGNGVCILGTDEGHVWALQTHPGARIRVTTFSILPVDVQAEEQVSELSSGTDWTMRGLPVHRVAQSIPLPIQLDAKSQEVVRVDVSASPGSGIVPIRLPESR